MTRSSADVVLSLGKQLVEIARKSMGTHGASPPCEFAGRPGHCEARASHLVTDVEGVGVKLCGLHVDRFRNDPCFAVRRL